MNLFDDASRLIIDPEFKELIPPLTADEYARLEQSILDEGCRDALVVWNNILIDGHNRYQICTEHNIPFTTANKDFADRNDVKLWMMQNQLARRNLNDAQRVAVVHKFEDAVKAKALERQLAGVSQQQGDLRVNLPEGGKGRARDELGSMAGVSGRTYERASKVLDEAPEVISKAMTDGTLSIHKAYEAVTATPEQQEEIAYRISHIDEEPDELTTPAKIISDVTRPHVANNSGNNEWYTPEEYIKLAREVMGSIDLDPASCEIANKTVGATKFYTKETNGLEHEWFGNVWLNPPYSTNLISKFADKLSAELPNIKNAIVLVNNATETGWFKKLVDNAAIICFPSSRVKFYTSDGKTGTPLQGQAVLYFGDRKSEFISAFKEKGWCVCPV